MSRGEDIITPGGHKYRAIFQKVGGQPMKHNQNSLSLGIELGSTRIKAVTVDAQFRPVSSGDYT